MNRKNAYHNYPYSWYWICSKVLGIKKCSLVFVPIYLQFKLVINNVFEEFPLNDKDYPSVDCDKPHISPEYKNLEKCSEINLVLEDTFSIDMEQLPDLKKNLFTIRIRRCDRCNGERHFSEEFIEAVIRVVRNLPDGIRVNVYATTNPRNTENIAKRAFSSGGRDNIRHLYVYQQTREKDSRVFEEKEHKIY